MIGLGNSVVKRKLGGGPPAAPVNVSQPFLVGTGEVGTVVTCNRGSWSGSPSPTYTYDFRIDSISVQNGSSNTYTPVVADNGKTLTCLVTATNPLGSASEGTSNSKVIGTAPVNTVLPTIDVTGNQLIGTVLTATDGTWTGSTPITYQYRWTRNGVAITGATTNTYTLQAADESATIRVQVRGINSYATSAYVTSDDSVVGGYAPVNTGLPAMSLSGNQLVGAVVTVTDGTWSGTPTITYQYRWLRNGSPIGGATTNSYTLQSADDGATITAEVRGVNNWGTSAYSGSNNSINAGSPPVNTVAPTVSPSGTQSTGTVITANVGTWDGTPTITYAYRWTRNGSPISGATASTYTIQLADDGTTIRCEVQGSNAFGTSAYVASSNSVSAVNQQAPVNTVAPVISGTAVVGQTLSSTTGTWTGVPNTFTYSYQWKRGATNIGTNSSTYTLVAADAGNTSNITCVVTATNTAGSANATSNTIAQILTVRTNAFMTASGISDATIRGALNTFDVGLISNSLDTKMKAVYPFVGGTADTHKWNFMDAQDTNAAFRLTFSGTWTHSSTGAKPNGTNAWANTFYNQTTVGDSLNSAHLSYYSRTNSNGTEIEIGTQGPSTTNYNILEIRTSGVTYVLSNQSGLTSFNDGNSLGYYISNRQASNDIDGWKNGVKQVNGTTASGSLPNSNIYIGAMRDVVSGNPTFYSIKESAFASIGSGFTDTEVQTLSTLVANMQTTLGRQV